MSKTYRPIVPALFVAGSLVFAWPALAQMPPPENVVNLSAGATVEVGRDWLTVVFSTTREGTDAGTLQAQLKQALEPALGRADEALYEAKRTGKNRTCIG